jgi:hypothetical protein
MDDSPTDLDALIRAAIEQKRLVKLVYGGKQRITGAARLRNPQRHDETPRISNGRDQQWAAAELEMDGSEVDL